MAEKPKEHGGTAKPKVQPLVQGAHVSDGTPVPSTEVIVPPIPDGPPDRGWPPGDPEPGDTVTKHRAKRGAGGGQHKP